MRGRPSNRICKREGQVISKVRKASQGRCGQGGTGQSQKEKISDDDPILGV